jgi:MFS family permease
VRLQLTGRLWRHHDFLRLWGGETVDLFGGQVIDLALPSIAILGLRANPFQVGLLVGLEFAAYPLLGLIAGVWADRLPRRPIMILSNVGPLLAYASIPLAAIVHQLSITQLYLVAFLTGVFGVFFEVAYQSYLPTLVERRDLVEANQKLEVSHSASHTFGPALGGVIVQWAGGANAMLAGVVSMLGSSLALISIRKREPKRSIDPASLEVSFWSELRAGLRLVTGNHILRGLTACQATEQLGFNVMQGVWLVFAYRLVHLMPAQVGLVLTLGAVGFIPGALLASMLVRRFGLGRVLVTAPITQAIGVLLIPAALLAPPLAILVLVLGWLLIYSPSSVFSINQVSLRQAITPDHLQGRMNATMRTMVWAAQPVGAVLGGALGSLIGVPQTILLGGVIALASPAFLLRGPVASLRTHPEPQTA